MRAGGEQQAGSAKPAGETVGMAAIAQGGVGQCSCQPAFAKAGRATEQERLRQSPAGQPLGQRTPCFLQPWGEIHDADLLAAMN